MGQYLPFDQFSCRTPTTWADTPYWTFLYCPWHRCQAPTACYTCPPEPWTPIPGSSNWVWATPTNRRWTLRHAIPSWDMPRKYFWKRFEKTLYFGYDVVIRQTQNSLSIFLYDKRCFCAESHTDYTYSTYVP